jgi:hypothetical protein
VEVPFDTDPARSYSSAFTPAGVQPKADGWLDVLRFGLGRLADYKIATVTPQNVRPTIGPASGQVASPAGTVQAVAASSSASWPAWLPWAVAAGAAALLFLRK